MRSIAVAYILWFFPLGLLGIHRFYCNRIGTGILWLLTGGLCGIGWLIDLFLVPGLVRSANEESRLLNSLTRMPGHASPPVVSVQDYSTPAGQTRPTAALAPGHRLLYCTHCGAPMQVPIQAVGGHFACPGCHQVVIAPG